MINTVSPWLKNNDANSDVLISCRFRLARNLSGFPFSTTITNEQKEFILKKIENIYPQLNIGKSLSFVRLDNLDPLDRLFLCERHLISKDMIKSKGAGVLFSEDESISIMINEEDHLRIQVIYGEFKPYALWEGLSMLDDQLNSFLPYSFREDLGYLTCCLTNVGCGFRIALLLHLPAMLWEKQFETFFKSIKIKQVNLRGVFGEGSQPIGSFFQVSNMSSFGQSEGEIINDMTKFLEEIIKYERKLRYNILKNSKEYLEDRIYRAFGVLKYARQISLEESLELLSVIRLGIYTEMISTISIDLFNELFLFTQPAHLQKYYKKHLSEKEINIKRAEFFKEKLLPYLN